MCTCQPQACQCLSILPYAMSSSHHGAGYVNVGHGVGAAHYVARCVCMSGLRYEDDVSEI